MQSTASVSVLAANLQSNMQPGKQLGQDATPPGATHGPGTTGTNAGNGFSVDLWNYLLSFGVPADSTVDGAGLESAASPEGTDVPGESAGAPGAARGFKGLAAGAAPDASAPAGKPDDPSKTLPRPQIIDPFGSLVALLFTGSLSGLKHGSTEPAGAALEEKEPFAAMADREPLGPAVNKAPLVRTSVGAAVAASGNSTASMNARDWQLAPDLTFAARLDVPRGPVASSVDGLPGPQYSNPTALTGPIRNSIDNQSSPRTSDSHVSASTPDNSPAAAPLDAPDAEQSGSPSGAALPTGSRAQNGDAQQSNSQDHPPDGSSSQPAGGDDSWRLALEVLSHNQNENGPRGGDPAKPDSAPPAAPAEPAPDPAGVPGAAGPQKTLEIGLRLETGTDSSVAVQLIERGGGVHVAVRTHDADLARSLQNNLSDLVGSLKKDGIGAEIWTPPAAQSQHTDTGNPGSRNGGDAFGPESGSQQRGQSGRRGSQERERRPQWVDSLDENFFAPVTS